MPKRLSMLKKILRKDAQTENIESTNLPGNPQTPELRCGGSSPARHDGEPQNAASEVADTASSRTSVESRNDVATPSKADNLWVKAEQKLMDDSNKSKLWQSYLDILASELGSDLKPSGTDERQNQLCQLFEAKTQELEEKRWKIRFGDHTTTVGDLLKRVSKNVIIAKDIINTAARASPPAAIACAGVTVVLTVSWLLYITQHHSGTCDARHLFTSTRCTFAYAYSFVARCASRRTTRCSPLRPRPNLRIDLPSPCYGRCLPIRSKTSVSRPKACQAL